MKSVRVFWLRILLAGLVAQASVAQVGCVTFPSLRDDPAPKTAAKPAAVKQELVTPPVNPDEVTDGNVHEKVEALRKELSREDK